MLPYLQCLTLLVQHGTDPDYIEEADLLIHQSSHPADDESRSGTCVCSQHHQNAAGYMSSNGTLDEVSEEVEDEEDDDAESSSCSPSCDCCQHSSSSTCHSPVHHEISKKNASGLDQAGRHEPFFLHPRKDSSLTSSNGSFFLAEKTLENGTVGKNRHQRHHRRNHQQEQQPFYLHDPKSIVYTRVRELFHHDYQQHRSIETESKTAQSAPISSMGGASSGGASSGGTSDLTSHVDSSESGSDSASQASHEDDHNNNLVIQQSATRLEQHPESSDSSSSSELPDNEYEEIYSVPSSNPRTVRRKGAHHPSYDEEEDCDVVSIPPPPGIIFVVVK